MSLNRLLVMGIPTHLLLLCRDSSSSQTFFIASSSAPTFTVPRSFTSTFLARSEWPLLTSQRGLSGSTRQPKNITMDGTAAKPSMYLAKRKTMIRTSHRGMGYAWSEVFIDMDQVKFLIWIVMFSTVCCLALKPYFRFSTLFSS